MGGVNPLPNLEKLKMTIPYTYLIGWTNQNKWYYGVRFAKNCNPKELWVSYFTSSKYVKEFVKKHGEPDIIKIRKIFNDAYSARLWEHKVLRKLKVVKIEKWINKSDNVSICPEYAQLGRKNQIGKILSVLTKNKISKSRIGQKRSEKSKLKQSLSVSGEKNHFYGKTHTDIFKFEQSERQKIKQLGCMNNNAVSIKYNNKIYGTMKQFSEETSISYYLINKMLATKQIEKVS